MEDRSTVEEVLARVALFVLLLLVFL